MSGPRRLLSLLPLVALVAGCLCSTSALAQTGSAHQMFETAPAGRPADQIADPMWAASPAPMLTAQAVAAGLDMASVDLRCRARPDGGLSGCVIVSESASGLGLGHAALTNARRWRLTSQAVNSARQNARIMFSMTF